MGTLLLVHAHPDDEAISTGGVMMKAKAHGHRVVNITATRGEAGEIYNMDEAASRPRLGDIRTEELKAAGEILGLVGPNGSLIRLGLGNTVDAVVPVPKVNRINPVPSRPTPGFRTVNVTLHPGKLPQLPSVNPVISGLSAE